MLSLKVAKALNLSKVVQTASMGRYFSSSVRDKELEFYTKLDDWWSLDGPQK